MNESESNLWDPNSDESLAIKMHFVLNNFAQCISYAKLLCDNKENVKKTLRTQLIELIGEYL